ncbi:flagellar assembly protein FliW [Dethiosulfatarculus sandiegensis]|nr:flagellar assembly protein FliW [Dethiosulfatarculus sandiegensis]
MKRAKMPEANPKEDRVKVQTSRFGEIEVPQEQVIELPQGMIGFPNFHRYVMVQHRPGSPFYWLQSLEQPSLAFAVVTPLVFDPKYEITLGGAETKLLKVEDPQNIQVWVVVTIPHGKPDAITANLKAPLVINLGNRKGAQVILDNPKYSVRQKMPS